MLRPQLMCQKCQRVGHYEKDYKVKLPDAGEKYLQNVTCYGCDEKGHLKNSCAKEETTERGEIVGERYVMEAENPQQNPNVVTGTFLVNVNYASILFYSGAEKSFVCTEFTHFIDITPVTLDTSYKVELADGKVVSTNTVLRGCTLALFDHLFKIDLLPTRLVYYEKIVHIPLPNGDILEIQGERPEKDPKSLSCIKADEKILKHSYSSCFPESIYKELSGDKMPKATTTDISLTKSYIPKVSKIPGISPTIAQFYKPIENRNIHEGRVVDQAYYKSNNIERLFTNIRFNCLFQINEPIVPRFILDFYSQVTVQTDEYGYLVISFMIQHEFITLTLAQFGQILKIPYNGQAVFTNEWDLASLEYSQETEGPYCTELPTPDDIRRLLELERVVVDRTIKSQTVSLNPNQILTKELSPDMKQWEELIRENVFGLGGHRDRLPACLAHMLYCVVAEEQYNLAYFFVKRIQCARDTPTANLPYGMFLTRLYRHVMET
ncbi:pentatricopeptide repeat-containing protein [Tanacetum coccineum]